MPGGVPTSERSCEPRSSGERPEFRWCVCARPRLERWKAKLTAHRKSSFFFHVPPSAHPGGTFREEIDENREIHPFPGRVTEVFLNEGFHGFVLFFYQTLANSFVPFRLRIPKIGSFDQFYRRCHFPRKLSAGEKLPSENEMQNESLNWISDKECDR